MKTISKQLTFIKNTTCKETRKSQMGNRTRRHQSNSSSIHRRRKTDRRSNSHSWQECQCRHHDDNDPPRVEPYRQLHRSSGTEHDKKERNTDTLIHLKGNHQCRQPHCQLPAGRYVWSKRMTTFPLAKAKRRFVFLPSSSATSGR